MHRSKVHRGGPSTTVVTGVTPTFTSAVTGAATQSFLTSAGITTGTAVTSVTAPTTTVTAITSGTNNPNLVTIAFDKTAGG